MLKQLPERNADSKFKIFTAALKAVEREDGAKILSCTASSSVEDLHGDTMTDDCVRDMARQAKEKGMTIFLNHRYAVPEDVMGKTIDTKTVSRATGDDGKAIYDFDLDLEVNQTNPRAVNTYAAIKDAGVKLGVSIGANIEEWEFKSEKDGWWGGLLIKKVNLLEASVVGIPANPRSWVQNAVHALKGAYSVDDTNTEVEDGDAAGALTEVKEAAADGVVKTGVEVPVGATATLTVKADGESEVVIDEKKEESEEAPEEETTSEEEAEDEAKKAEAPTSPVDLEAAKSAVAELDSQSGDSSVTKDLILSLIAAVEKAVGERDAALAEKAKSEAMVKDAAEIIAKIVSTPLGRRTAFAGPVKQFQAKFAGIYDREFLALLERD
jgi:HK97 family phage prohead protease